MKPRAHRPPAPRPRSRARLLALWVVAWLAVVAVQATLAVHSELGDHPDEEACGLCAAAAGNTAWVPPDVPLVDTLAWCLPPAPVSLPSRPVVAHSAWQARAPPAHS